MTLLPIVIVGNPGHRRVEWFVDAALAEGLPAPHVISHTDLIEAPERLAALAPAQAIIRLESVGQSHAVAQLLTRAGEGAVSAPARAVAANAAESPTNRFELRAPRQLHAGYVRYLRALGEVARSRPGWQLTSPTESIERCFDKNATAEWLASRGVAVPEPLGSPTSPAELDRHMDRGGVHEAWVKLPYASSASGLAVVRQTRSGRVVHSTVAAVDGPEGTRFFNTRRVRRYDGANADRVLSFLLDEGARVERAVDKTFVNGRFVDLRVLVVAGEPAFVVARGSRHPITNLHLGGCELPLDEVLPALREGELARALVDAVAAADALGAFHLGVDVAFDRRTGRAVFLELNAFGDLLPRARKEGLDPYRYELRALQRCAARDIRHRLTLAEIAGPDGR